MVIISNVTYPPESARDMATRFLEAPQVPEYMTRMGPYVSSNTASGIFIVTVYELDNTRLAEGLDFIGNYLAIFFGIPGFKYEVKPYFDVAEGLKMLGM
jgi:hypothetical protein